MNTVAIEVGRVVPPCSPHFHDPARLDELVASVREIGLCTPPVVRPAQLGVFELVDGLLRFQAVVKLGWREVPAIVLDLDDRAAARERLARNAARRTVSPLEEARLLRYLLERGDEPVAIARALGRSPGWVRGRLELLEQLVTSLHVELEAGELSPTLALEIASAPLDVQESLRRAARDHGLTAHAVGRLAGWLAAPGRTAEDRERALSFPASVLARPGREPPSPTPFADRIEDVSVAVADLERDLARARSAVGSLPSPDREASRVAAARLRERLRGLARELEHLDSDPQGSQPTPAGGALSLPRDRIPPPHEPQGAVGGDRPDPPVAAATAGRGSGPPALEADDPAVARDLLRDGGRPPRGTRAEGPQGLGPVEEGPARAPRGVDGAARGLAAPQPEVDPREDRAPEEGLDRAKDSRAVIPPGWLRPPGQAPPDPGT